MAQMQQPVFDDFCANCSHPWHGSSFCGRDTPVMLKGQHVMYITKRGAGPEEIFTTDRAEPKEPMVENVVRFECACRG